MNKEPSLLLLQFMEAVNRKDHSCTVTIQHAGLSLFSQGRSRVSIPIKRICGT